MFKSAILLVGLSLVDKLGKEKPSVRLLKLETYNAYMNMAIDEAIARLRSKDRTVDTLRFYRWKPSAVSVGYFQNTAEEVDLDECRRLNVDVVRRMTGGGAVYHDYNGEITYSIIVKEDSLGIPRDILKSYEVICGGIVLGLRNLGLDAEFKPVNDIQVGGKKISGNAQTRRWGTVLQHGTVLVDADIKTMFRVLKVGKEKISDKLIKAVEERVTTINRVLGKKIGFTEVYEALKGGFEKALNIRLHEGELTEEEKDLSRELYEKKYTRREWNLERPSKKLVEFL
ncbi:lipoate--protein ligase family protein [Candidatus Bathyarchaeota archaeon]|nr:MAG: lipoate--protein ligase family protein [Candidatus Bathyarchaeota archaeon]